MATIAQNKEFANDIFPSYPLDEAIDYIGSHLDPEDVFDDKRLETWAIDHGFIPNPNTD